MPSNKFYPGFVTNRTLTFMTGQKPYLNGAGGTRGTQVSIAYYPDSRRRRPKGVDLIRSGTGMSVEQVTERNPVLTKTVISGNSVITTQLGSHNAGSANAVNWSEDEALVASQIEARNRLIKKLKNERLNLGTNLLEVRQTATAVQSFAKSVSDVLVQPKMKLALKFFRTYGTRRNFRRAWTAKQWEAYAKDSRNVRIQDAVGGYFSYIYGLKPMMSDITNAVEGLTDLYNSQRDQFKTVTSRYTTERRKIVRIDPQSDVVYNRGGKAEGLAKATTRISAMYRFDTSVKTATEFGVTNPVASIYNAIPYSFVLDWIIPVGDYLSSLDANQGISEFLSIENSVYSVSTWATSGHEIDTIRKYRSSPSATLPEFEMRYAPSEHISNMLNGILLLKQRYN